MISLYDYLGRAAGSTLGKEVAAAATLEKVKYGEKFVTTRTYTGKILMYPKEWLDQYFKNK